MVGAVLIVVADQDTRASFGYFFAAPGDTLGNAWSAIAHGYGALFQGAIFDPGLAATGRWARSRRSRTPCSTPRR